MDTQRICPSCGKALTADAPQGLCAECLIQAGFDTSPGTPGADFVPLSVPAVGALFPQLEVLELVGKGGMGAVYKARQPTLDRFVALKILPPQAGNDPGFAERFAREARALAKLNHPNIVAVYDFGQVNGLHYFIMEYIDGPNLRQLEQAGKLAPREALQIIPQVCEALQYAHDEGIVHRDIKPENVLLSKKGRVKIADFGLAKILGREPTQFRLTGARDIMGTPHYMAPEQVEHPQAVDHRADIYSLGVVFYEMLTGELPLGRFVPPSQKAQIDVRLDEVVLRALEKEPERRYQHAREVKTDVEELGPSASLTSAKVPAVGEIVSNELDAVRQQVKGPAIGLLVTGIVNWVLLPLALFLLAPPEHTILWHPGSFARVAIIAALLIPLLFCSFIILAGLKMRQLEAYRAAFTASILAMLVTPGNLVGLPIGIWSLVTLTKPAVRQGFRKTRAAENGSRWRDAGWATLLGVIAVLTVIASLGMMRHSANGPAPSADQVMLKTFSSADKPISQDLVLAEDGSWLASSTSTQIFRLFELPEPGVEQCVVLYSAQLKSEGLKGRAYLEMWCRFPRLGEAFSRGLDNVIVGSNDWATYQIPFYLKAGEKPDRIRLNLVVEGQGKVFIKDVTVTASKM